MSTPPHPAEQTTDALNQQALLYLQQGRLAEALAASRKAVVQEPQRPALWFNLGFIAHQAGETAEAITSLQQYLQHNPNDGHAWLLLGQSQAQLRQHDAASQSLTRAAVILSMSAAPLLELGRLAIHRRDHELGILHLRHALHIDPEAGLAQLNLGELYHELGMWPPALQHLQQACALLPRHAGAWLSLGACLYSLQRYREALDKLETSRRLDATNPALYNNLAMVNNALGNSAEALGHFRQTLQLRPDFAVGLSNLLLHSHYQADITPEAILALAQDYARLLGEIPCQFPVAADLAHRRIRIGYISGDLRQHAVGLFIEPVLAHHDKSRFEVFAYADIHTPDSRTARLREHTDHWRSIDGLGDEAILQAIRQDGIDILVDLAGHTANNHLPVFARRAAAVQISWLGYPGTTGLSNMDYLVTDQYADPPDATTPYLTEQPLRLEHGMFCYQPEQQWAGATPVNSLPALTNGFITFASFNNLAKVNDETLDLWRRVLEAVPGSRLLIKGKPFNDPLNVEAWQQRLATLGFTPARISLRPYDTLDTHMASYQTVDIHLDTFPYSGGTTTWDALWMGVPVLTLTGPYRPSRVSASILHHAGLGDWVADSAADYIAIAVSKAANLDALAQLRAELRPRIKNSPAHNAALFTRSYEQALLGTLPVIQR